jgi:hypothetical protein
MTAPIEDVSSLPGKKVADQEDIPIGEVKEIYAIDGDGHPMWVGIEASFGLGEKRNVLVPLARLKEEDGTVRVPYSKRHIGKTPEVDTSDGISEHCDQMLRAHFGIDRGDQELREDNKSYATLVPEEEGEAERVDDAEQIETPDPDKRTEETKERLQDPGSSEIRKVDAGAIADQNANEEKGDGGDEQDSGKAAEQTEPREKEAETS